MVTLSPGTENEVCLILVKKFGLNVMKVSIWLDRKTLFAKEMENGNHNRFPNVFVEVSLNAFEKLITVCNFCCSDAYKIMQIIINFVVSQLSNWVRSG